MAGTPDLALLYSSLLKTSMATRPQGKEKTLRHGKPEGSFTVPRAEGDSGFRNHSTHRHLAALMSLGLR